jgi:hypothetical protein
VRAATPYVIAILFSAGCGQILDIEEAHLIATAGAGGAPGVNDAGASSTTGVGGAEEMSFQGGRTSDGGAAGAAGAGGAGGEGGRATGGAGDAGDAGSSGTGGSPSRCDEYCSLMATGCSGKDAQYIDADACHEACRWFPAGAPGDTQGNTLGCRLTYANKAHSEPYTYCTWAGPGGDGRCGTNCEGFCTLMMAACTPASTGPGHAYFDSPADCLASCEELADVGSYSTSNTSLQMGADHVQCRLYHVGAALAEDDAFTHCPHAIGERLCVDAPSGLEAGGP